MKSTYLPLSSHPHQMMSRPRMRRFLLVSLVLACCGLVLLFLSSSFSNFGIDTIQQSSSDSETSSSSTNKNLFSLKEITSKTSWVGEEALPWTTRKLASGMAKYGGDGREIPFTLPPTFLERILPSSISSPVAASTTTGNIKDTTSREEVKRMKEVCDEISSRYSLKNMYTMPLGECRNFMKACGLRSCDSQVDIVFLWVNGSEPAFLKRKQDTLAHHTELGKEGFNGDAGKAARFRELGQFRYSLRSVEENMLWARRIFIVTDSQTPSWLNVDHPQIRMISHTDLHPTPIHPLFNSMAIQSMIHTIPGISSPFMYSEDDIYFGKPVRLDQIWDSQNQRATFYLTGNIPAAKPEHMDVFQHSIYTSMDMATSKGYNTTYFYKGDQIMFNTHICQMIFPEHFETIWKLWPEVMLTMSQRSFRHQDDPHLWALYSFLDGEQKKSTYQHERDHAFMMLHESIYDDVMALMIKIPSTFVCINDDFNDLTEEIKKEVEAWYTKLFPKRSHFELTSE